MTDEAPEPPAEVAETPDADNPETLARIHGWRPREEYKGAKPFVEAAAYLAEAQEANPLLKAQNKRLAEANRDLAKKAARFEKMIEQARGFEERAYARALADLRTEHREAVETGDIVAAERASDEIATLKADAISKPKVADEPDELPPAEFAAFQERIKEWIEDSPYYYTDDAKTRYSDLQSDSIIKKHGALHKFPGGLDAALAEIDRAVDRKFADKKPLLTNGAGNRQATGNGKGYADLDPQGKQMAQDMVKAGIFKTTDEYAKEVFASAR